MYDNSYRIQGFSFLPTVVKNLLIINGIFFLADITFNTLGIDLTRYLGLHFFTASHYFPTQFVTYLFMHANFSHLFFNMFALWMFGYNLENLWGSKRFLLYYLVTGIGAGFIQQLVMGIDLQQYEAYAHIPGAMQQVLNSMVTVGASGSVFGLLLAFGWMFPNTRIYVYFLVPIKAKWFVVIYGVIELLTGISGAASGVAHFAHLGGMLFGALLIIWWRRRRSF